MFCRKIRGKLFTTRTIEAASTWMLDNGFEEGKCTERSADTLKMRYVPPEDPTTTKTTAAPKKSKGTTETTSTETTKPTKKTKESSNTTKEKDQDT